MNVDLPEWDDLWSSRYRATGITRRRAGLPNMAGTRCKLNFVSSGIYSSNYYMNILASLTSAQLKHAADLKDQITKLEMELGFILGASAPVVTARKKSKMSAAGRAKIAAAQKARWAKVKNTKPAPVVKKKSKMSAAGRAKLAAAQKVRGAKGKPAGQASA